MVSFFLKPANVWEEGPAFSVAPTAVGAQRRGARHGGGAKPFVTLTAPAAEAR
jgi:hypothetical protein